MLEKLSDFLCGAQQLAFESDFGLDETVKRLAAQTQGPFATFQALMSRPGPVIVGKVSERNVSLQCAHMFFRNAFGPMFIGRFELVDGRVILIGKLSMHPMIGGMQVLWLAAMAVFAVDMLWELVKDASPWPNWLSLLGPPLGVLFILAANRFGKWLSSDDEPWILHAINLALYKIPLKPTS
jgi:hypothetical protein